MTKFSLPDTKVKEIQKYCNLIYDRSRKLNVKDNILDTNRTGKEINLQGMGAEIWYKEKHNIPYSLETILEEGPRTYKKDIDCIREARKLEIKQTSYPTGCLFLAATDHYKRPRELISDMYVLIVGDFPNYTKDLHITYDELYSKFFNKTSNKIEATIHPKIGKFGYHVEQDEMYETMEEAIHGRSTSKRSSTLS
mgnify:CR=1 FL=1